jgi:hypothetical protein
LKFFASVWLKSFSENSDSRIKFFNTSYIC